MLREYRWNGLTWQIDDADLDLYPGAEPIEPKKPARNRKTATPKKAEPAVNDKSQAPANKARKASNKTATPKE